MRSFPPLTRGVATNPQRSTRAVPALVPFLLFAAVAAHAAASPTFQGSLSVTSTPPGGNVLLKGPLQANGITPFWAPRFPVGTYRVEVSRKGYYTKSARVLLSQGDSLHVDAQLKSKPRLMGFARSLVVPGWGQMFNERPRRGVFFLTAEIVAAGVAGYYATQYNHAVSRYDAMADSLNSATTLEAANIYAAKLAEREVAWQSHYDHARNAAFVAAGIWAVAALDALVFGPVREELPGVRLRAGSASMSPRIAVSVDF